ncbi:MAG TPA: MoaD/ThiS family protein [Flavisolibacter sp.]|nr:MoaD/ThiS family protein [Flavisolibacter sp.]
MRVNILAFGIAKEILGRNQLAFDFQGSTSQDLKMSLEQQFPYLKQLPSYGIAVNNEYVTGTIEINSNDEIAIIPPVSGG